MSLWSMVYWKASNVFPGKYGLLGLVDIEVGKIRAKLDLSFTEFFKYDPLKQNTGV